MSSDHPVSLSLELRVDFILDLYELGLIYNREITDPIPHFQPSDGELVDIKPRPRQRLKRQACLPPKWFWGSCDSYKDCMETFGIVVVWYLVEDSLDPVTACASRLVLKENLSDILLCWSCLLSIDTAAAAYNKRLAHDPVFSPSQATTYSK